MLQYTHSNDMSFKKQEPVFIYGRHAVLEALEKRVDIVHAVFVREDVANDAEVEKVLRGVSHTTTFKGNHVPRGVDPHATHQGLIAEIDPGKLLVPFKQFRDELREVDASTSLVVLGEVQDPHNVGAIIRSAAAFGCRAVLLPEHRGCPVTGTVIKTSAGTAFNLPLVSVGNINTALKDLKDHGFWVYGLDGDGDVSLYEEDFSKPSVFVVGNEATGIRAKTHDACDTILSIPISDRAESLNASVSAAVVLSGWNRSNLSKT